MTTGCLARLYAGSSAGWGVSGDWLSLLIVADVPIYTHSSGNTQRQLLYFDYSINHYARIEAEVAEDIAAPCDKLAGSQVIERS